MQYACAALVTSCYWICCPANSTERCDAVAPGFTVQRMVGNGGLPIHLAGGTVLLDGELPDRWKKPPRWSSTPIGEC